MEYIEAWGCDTAGFADGTYRVHVWAEYEEGHLPDKHPDVKDHPLRGWVKLLSIYEGKNADKKADTDCLDWRRQVKRMRTEYKRTQRAALDAR
jgi:hypothetical protein